MKILFVGGLVYGAYKLGQKKGQQQSQNLQMIEIDDEIEIDKSEEDYIRELIDSLRKKPSKTRKDRDIIELLEVKLKQLLNQ